MFDVPKPKNDDPGGAFEGAGDKPGNEGHENGELSLVGLTGDGYPPVQKSVPDSPVTDAGNLPAVSLSGNSDSLAKVSEKLANVDFINDEKLTAKLGELFAEANIADGHSDVRKKDGFHERYFRYGQVIFEDIQTPARRTETSYNMLGNISCQRITTADGKSETYLRIAFNEYKVSGEKVLKKEPLHGKWVAVSDENEIKAVAAAIEKALEPPRLISK